MKVQFDKKEDILTLQLGKEKIDDAYETENMIVHVAKNREPVLLEIFDATKFLIGIKKILPPKTKNQVFAQ